MQAMACDLPVVATRVEGSPEVIEEGMNGYPLSIGDYNELA
jgi:glycosyltransferase involved in cell wall biosynthesis